MKQISTSH